MFKTVEVQPQHLCSSQSGQCGNTSGFIAAALCPARCQRYPNQKTIENPLKAMVLGLKIIKWQWLNDPKTIEKLTILLTQYVSLILYCVVNGLQT